MKRKRNAHLTKQEYVNVTSQIIAEEGLENLSIRRIAQRVGCDPAVLYRHFTNLDFLILVCCIRFLEDYIKDLAAIERIEQPHIDHAIDSWHVFSNHAFQNPKLFYHVFYDCDTLMFEDAITEYFQLFPFNPADRTDDFYGFVFSSLFTGSPYERNQYYFGRAAGEGSIKYEDIDFLCSACPYVFSGILREFANGILGDMTAEAATRKCNFLVDRVIDSCRIDDREPRIASLEEDA